MLFLLFQPSHRNLARRRRERLKVTLESVPAAGSPGRGSDISRQSAPDGHPHSLTHRLVGGGAWQQTGERGQQHLAHGVQRRRRSAASQGPSSASSLLLATNASESPSAFGAPPACLRRSRADPE